MNLERGLKGRRPYPFITPRLEMITFEKGVVINASSDIISLVKYKFKGKTRFEDYALQYNVKSLHPEVLAIVVRQKGDIVGVASAVEECKTLWQINVDVLSPYRGNNLAVIMVNTLTIEVLNRGIVPYYSTDCSNLASQRVAVKSGYIPTWSHCFRTSTLTL